MKYACLTYLSGQIRDLQWWRNRIDSELGADLPISNSNIP